MGRDRGMEASKVMGTALAISRAHTQEAEEEKAQIDTVFRCILDYCFTQQKVPLSLCLADY